MPSLAEIIDRARQIAEGRGADPFKNPVLNAGMTAEALVPHALRHVMAAASIEDVEETRVDHDIELDPDNLGTVPTTIIRKHMAESFLPDFPRSALLPWTDYHRPRFDNMLCYYAHRAGQFETSCQPNYGELVRTIDVVSKAANSDWVDAASDAGAPATGTLIVLETGAHARGQLRFLNPSVAATGTLTITQGVSASGSLTLTAQPTNGETIVVNGFTITFRTTAGAAPAPDVQIGHNLVETAANLAAFLNASTSALLNVATYTAGGVPSDSGSSDSGSSGSSLFSDAPASVPPQIITIIYDTYGTAGNAYTLEDSSGGHITRSDATLTGGLDGVVDDETLNINGVQFTFDANVGPPPIAPSESTRLPFYASAEATATAVAETLNNSTNALISVATYTASDNVVTITYDTLGGIGNMFALFDSSGGAVTRSGAHLTGGLGGIVEGETIAVNGVTFTFTNFARGGTFIPFRDNNASYNATQAAAVLNASTDPLISVATYSIPSSEFTPLPHAAVLDIVYDTGGAGGNSFTLAESSYGGVTRSAATLLGGGGTGIGENDTIVVNGITFTFKASPVGDYQIDFTGDQNADALLIAEKLNAAEDDELTVASYEAVANEIYITYNVNGVIGNSYTLANSSSGSVLASGATLLGGAEGFGTGLFVALTDVARRIVVTEDGVEVLNAIIEERITTDRVSVTNYRIGDMSTAITAGVAKIYETTFEQMRAGTCSKDAFTQTVVDNENGAVAADVGRAVLVYDQVTGDLVIRAIIDTVEDDGSGFTIVGYAAKRTLAADPFTVNRILDPVITLNAPSLPSIPSDPDEEIDAPAKIIENTILTVAGALTGEIAVETLLGIARMEQK